MCLGGTGGNANCCTGGGLAGVTTSCTTYTGLRARSAAARAIIYAEKGRTMIKELWCMLFHRSCHQRRKLGDWAFIHCQLCGCNFDERNDK